MALRSPTSSRAPRRSKFVGLIQVRQLDPTFEAAEWECTHRAVVARHRRLPRGGAAGRIVRVRHARHAPPRSARAAAERPRQRRAAQARRGAGRRPAPLGAPRRRILRSGALVDAEGGLGRALGLDRASRPLMNQLPRAARYYVTAVIARRRWRCSSCACRRRRSISRVLFSRCSLLSSMSASLKVYLPLTTSGSTMSVSYAVDFASLLLLGPHETMLVAAGSAFSQCHLNSKERNPLYRTLFSVASLVITVQATGLAFHLLGGGARHGDVADRAGAAAGRRGDGLLPAEHRPRRDGDRAVDAHADRQHLAQQLPVERAELLRRRRHRRARRLVRRRTPATGWRR